MIQSVYKMDLGFLTRCFNNGVQFNSKQYGSVSLQSTGIGTRTARDVLILWCMKIYIRLWVHTTNLKRKYWSGLDFLGSDLRPVKQRTSINTNIRLNITFFTTRCVRVEHARLASDQWHGVVFGAHELVGASFPAVRARARSVWVRCWWTSTWNRYFNILSWK